MIRKRSRDSSSQWKNYAENFSELMQHGDPTLSSSSQEINESPFSEDNDSADLFSDPVSESKRPCIKNNSDTKTNLKNPLSSPIVSSNVSRRKSVLFSKSLMECCTPDPEFASPSPSGSKHIRSTPSGSPILHKSLLKSRGALIPISPITPGADYSLLDNSSVFTVHSSDTTIRPQFCDQTTLATPLDISDDEIEDYSQGNGLFTKKSHTKDEEDIEISDFESQKVERRPKNVLNTTGTKWIKNIQQKIEEDWQKKVAKLEKKAAFNETHSCYDSGKKLKCLKGGLAEKLTGVIKKENAQKSVFMQMFHTKKLQTSDALCLKILSDSKEGFLRIIECKKADDNTSFTLILPGDVADNFDFHLGLDIQVYPPFERLQMQSSGTTVLLSAFNIITNPGVQLCDSEKDSQIFENLLNCLETVGCTDGISIVATVQRIFCRLNSGEKWSLLCSDAYGALFLVDTPQFSDNASLIRLLSHGEGNRVIFKNLLTKGRAVRSQQPSLFGVIDSVWDMSGNGLLIARGSQSQNSTSEFVSISPPSFCYLFNTNDTSWVIFPTKEVDLKCSSVGCVKTVCDTVGDINRPPNADDRQNCSQDTMYRASNLVKLSEIFRQEFDENQRFSVVSKFVEFIDTSQFDSQDLYSSQRNLITLKISDSYTVGDSELYELLVKNSCLLPRNMTTESYLVFKDARLVSDKIIADEFSRVKLCDCVCEIEQFLHQPIGALDCKK